MNIARTSVMGVVASLVMGGSLLVPFRIGIDVIGPNEVGAWAMIQGLFIICRLPEMGVGLNLTRAVAAERRNGEAVDPRPYIWAAGLLTIVPVICIGCVLFAIIPKFFEQIFTGAVPLTIVRTLCLLALGGALFSTISTILLSIIEGCGLLIHRQIMTMVSNLALIIFAYPLITNLGVIGLALTYAISSLLLLVFSAVAALAICSDLSPNKSNLKIVIKELWFGNLQVSAMAVTRITYEPLTKFVVGSFGNLAAVVYVDLAMKLTLQVRVVVQSAVQPLLAFGARGNGDSHERIIKTFERAQSLVIKSNLMLMSCQFLAAGAVSIIALSELSPTFIIIYFLLVIGNGINSFGVVGYYYDASAGNMGKIVSIHVQMMLINGVFGVLGGWLLGEQAAVAAYAFSFAFGGVMLYKIWSLASGQGWLKVLEAECWQIASTVSCLLLSIICFLGRWVVVDDALTSVAGLLLASVLAGSFLLNNWQAFRGKAS